MGFVKRRREAWVLRRGHENVGFCDLRIVLASMNSVIQLINLQKPGNHAKPSFTVCFKSRYHQRIETTYLTSKACLLKCD